MSYLTPLIDRQRSKYRQLTGQIQPKQLSTHSDGPSLISEHQKNTKNLQINIFTRVESFYLKIWDIQIKKIEGVQSTVPEQELTNFILQTTEFPTCFYKDDAQLLGRMPDTTKITPDMLLDMHRGFKKKLPINHPLHFNWKIGKADKTNGGRRKTSIQHGQQPDKVQIAII